MDVPYQTAPIHMTVKFSAWSNRCGLILADLVGFAVAFALSQWFVSNGENTYSLLVDTISGQARVWSYMALVTAGIGWFWSHRRHYTYRKSFWNELREVIITIFALAVADLAFAALSRWEFSRIHWALLWSFAFLFVPSSRYIMKLFLTKIGYWQWPSVIIGCGSNAKEAYLAIQSEKIMGFDIIGFVAPDDTCMQSPVTGKPLFRDDISVLVEHFKEAKFFIAVEYEQRELRDNWIRHLTQRGIRNISVIPTLRGVPLYGTDMSHFFSHEVLMLRVRNNLARFSARLLKRLFDLSVSSLLLLLLSPLLGYIAWKVSRDGGSPIYGHERVGRGGNKFKCLKFRSMIINSQEVLNELLTRDSEARAEWEKDFKLKNDPRITSIGHLIRKTSLDELPQLWNVIKGDMSLVGPRPVVQQELERYGDDVEYYLLTNPGMTGLWQVSGRNDTDYSTRIYLDAWYVKNWSLWYDIVIMFKTINVVLRRDGAY